MKEVRLFFFLISLGFFVFTSNITLANQNIIGTEDLLDMEDMVSRITLQNRVVFGQKVGSSLSFILEVGVLYASMTFLKQDSLYLVGLMGTTVCQWAAQARLFKEYYRELNKEFYVIKRRWEIFDSSCLIGSKKRALWQARYDTDQEWIANNKHFLDIKFRFSFK